MTRFTSGVAPSDESSLTIESTAAEHNAPRLFLCLIVAPEVWPLPHAPVSARGLVVGTVAVGDFRVERSAGLH